MTSSQEKPALSKRLRYYVDLITSKGVVGVFFLAAVGTLIILLVLVPLLTALQILVTGKGSWSQIPGTIWADFSQVFKLGNGKGTWVDQLATASIGFLGIFFTGILFGILVSSVSDKLKGLRTSGGEVICSNHTAVLGWSALGETVLEELAIANENQRKPVITILDEKSKLSNEESARELNLRNSQTLFRQGEPDITKDLDCVRLDVARKAVILPDWGSDDYDRRVIRQILATSRYKEKHNKFDATVVAALKRSLNVPAARMAANFNLVLIDVEQFLTRIMLRTTIQPGLYAIYSELLSFSGDELYCVQVPELVGKTMGEALLGFPTSSPVGLKTSRGSFLNPDLSTVIGPDDALFVITRDDDTAILGAHPPIDETAIIGGCPEFRGTSVAAR